MNGYKTKCYEQTLKISLCHHISVYITLRVESDKPIENTQEQQQI